MPSAKTTKSTSSSYSTPGTTKAKSAPAAFTATRPTSPKPKTPKKWVDDCFSKIDVITQEEFQLEDDDDVVRIFPIINNTEAKAHCIPKESIAASVMANMFGTIMVEWVPVKDEATSSIVSTRRSISKTRRAASTRPTNYEPGKRIFVKLPIHNIYVSFKSFLDLIRNRKPVVKEWMLVPFLEPSPDVMKPMRVRLGNVEGLHGRSMNHAQSDETVYKIVKRSEWFRYKREQTRMKLCQPRENEFSIRSNRFRKLFEKDITNQLDELHREVEAEIMAEMNGTPE